MVDPLTTRRWSYRGLFIGLAAVILFTRLLPLSTLPAIIPGPDLLLCLCFAWVLRRPDFLPVLVVALVFLAEDILLMRPPGLWTLIVLLASEFLRDRAAQLREAPFLAEWTLVAAAMLAMLILNRFVLAVFMVPQTGLGLTLMQAMASILAYPLVVLVSQRLLRVRWTGSGEPEGRTGFRP